MQLGTGDFFTTAVHIAFVSRPETQHSVKPRVTTEHPRETSLECKTLKTSLNIQITPRGGKEFKTSSFACSRAPAGQILSIFNPLLLGETSALVISMATHCSQR